MADEMYSRFAIDSSRVGEKHGKLTVIGASFSTGRPGDKTRKCVARCDCGRTTLIDVWNLGHTISCGCARSTKKGLVAKFRRERNIWRHMIERCYRPGTIAFPKYGARGISVCDRWRNSFEAFIEDMGPAPKGHSIERRDCNGNYTPENCRWASSKEQGYNKRNTRWIEVDGRAICAKQFAAEQGLPYKSFHRKLQQGKSVSQAVSELLVRAVQ